MSTITPNSIVELELGGAPKVVVHATFPLQGPPGTTDWNGLQNVPTAFPPLPHTHTTADITDFNVAVQTLADARYALLGHSHPMSDVSGLAAALAGKQPLLGFAPLNPASNLSDLAHAPTARANLGLGSIATLAASAKQDASAELGALSGLSDTGLVRRTGAGTYSVAALAVGDVPAPGADGALPYRSGGVYAASGVYWDSAQTWLGVNTAPGDTLHVAGPDAALRLQNTAPGGQTARLWAGTSGLGVGTAAQDQQVIISADAPGAAVIVGASRLLIGTPDGIASTGDFLYLKANSSTGAGSVRIQGFNSLNNWETVFEAPGRAGKVNAHLVTNGGLVAVGHTTPVGRLHVQAGQPETIGQIIEGAVSQSARLTEWRNSAGVSNLYVGHDQQLWFVGGNKLRFHWDNSPDGNTLALRSDGNGGLQIDSLTGTLLLKNTYSNQQLALLATGVVSVPATGAFQLDGFTRYGFDPDAGEHLQMRAFGGATVRTNYAGTVRKFNFRADGHFENETAGVGLILKSPGGTRYRVTVSDAGSLEVTAL